MLHAGPAPASGASTSTGLGIATKDGSGWMGSHQFDYAYYNGLGKRNNREKWPYGDDAGAEPWKSGDVFKVQLKLKPGETGTGILNFWRNGKDLGVAFDNIVCKDQTFYPTFSFDKKRQTFILVDGHALYDNFFPSE